LLLRGDEAATQAQAVLLGNYADHSILPLSLGRPVEDCSNASKV
jgi:hypothetical protein